MKTLILFTLIIICTTINAQIIDTIISSEFEIANREYKTLTPLSSLPLLDRAVTIDRNQIKRMREDSTSIKNIQDFMMLYHSFNLSDPIVDRADSTFIFTQKVFNYWNEVSADRGRFTLPIGIIYKEATFIKDDSYQNGDLFVNTNQPDEGWQLSAGKTFADVSETHHYFAIAPTYDIPIYDQEISFVLSPEFIFSEKAIDHINLNYGAISYTLNINDTIDFDLNANDTIFNFNVHFVDGQVLSQSINFIINDEFFEDKSLPKQTVFTGGKHTFKSQDFGKLRYGIIWGECNNTGHFRKPFFMLHGLRTTLQPITPGLGKLYRKKFNFKGYAYGNDGFVDLLVKNGYDVVIIRIDPGYKSIRRGGKLLASFFLNVVEPSKAAIGSKHENVVLGFSMGGHYWRHMIMYLEHKHLNENYGHHHHTRLWIPFDTPLHGVNIPLAHQFAAKSLKEHPAGIPNFNIAYNNMSKAGPQEQMRYHFDGYAGNDGAPHRSHQKRIDYNFELENTYYLGPSLTKYRGFPSSTRNVAVSVGSFNKDHYPELTTGAKTYEEQSFFNPSLYFKTWDVLLNSAEYRSTSTNPKEVFHRKITRQWAFSTTVQILVDDYFSLHEWLEMDNCYGSYFNAIRNTINFGLRSNSKFGFTDYVYKDNSSFVPTLSALAINPSEWPNNMRYDMKANGLLFDELSDNILLPDQFASDHFGYPHLGRPNDYQTLTPMDAVYINADTYQHISLIKKYPWKPFIDNSALITFLLNEVEPWYLDLQNQNFGEYARSNYTYKAHYQAKKWIRMGSNISPKTPFGDYNIQSNIDAEYQSEEIIELKPGSHIQAGAKVHLYISPLCYLQGGGKSLTSLNEPDEDNYYDDKWNDSTENQKWEIYPNPSRGTLSIKSKFVKKGDMLYIYSMMGVLIDKFVLDDNGTIDISNLVGRYNLVLVQWHSKNGIIGTRKLLLK